MNNTLGLLAGIDIPFPQGGIVIHPPKIREIAYIGEDAYFSGLQLLTFTKDKLLEKDKSNLEGVTNFEVILSTVNNPDQVLIEQQEAFMMLLTILFPGYQVQVTNDAIFFLQDGVAIGRIDKNNFNDFKQLIAEMFCVQKEVEESSTPKGEMFRRIEEQLKKRQMKLAKLKGEKSEDGGSIFGKYISILSVGEQKDMNELLNYTVYQLFDEFQRFDLKMGFDYYVQAKMAGASDLKEVDDWMKEIHS